MTTIERIAKAEAEGNLEMMARLKQRLRDERPGIPAPRMVDPAILFSPAVTQMLNKISPDIRSGFYVALQILNLPIPPAAMLHALTN